MSRLIRGEGIRFLVAGAGNTAASYLIYLALLEFIGYTAAYTLAYAAGILFAYVLGTRFVFRTPHSLKGLLLFPSVYLLQYLLGVIVLHVAVDTLGIPAHFAALLSIAATLPATFFASRTILKRFAGETTDEETSGGHSAETAAVPMATCQGIALLACAVTVAFFGLNSCRTYLVADVHTQAGGMTRLFSSPGNEAGGQPPLLRPMSQGWARLVFPMPLWYLGRPVRLQLGHANDRIESLHWVHGIGMQAVIAGNGGDGMTARPAANDTSWLVPAPSRGFLVASVLPDLALLGFACLAIWVLSVRRQKPVVAAMASIGACAVLYVADGLRFGPILPLYDDWRYLLPGPFNLVDGGWSWLTIAGNDTYFLVNQLADFCLLKLSGVDFLSIRLFAFAVLLGFLIVQFRILRTAAGSEPWVTAIGVLLCLWSLGGNAYWGGTAIAYQQALPVLFASLVLLQLLHGNGSLRSRASWLLISLFCLAAGLSYISGGVLILAVGAALLLACRHRIPRITTNGWWLIVWGTLLLLVQIALVTQRQGSLFEHNHAVESVYPNDRRFWLFFAAQFGRALGYAGLDWRMDMLCAAVVLAPALAFTGTALLKRPTDTQAMESRHLLALYAGIAGAAYAAMVAFGRAGFIPVHQGTEAAIAFAKGRFHYWPIATMIPYAWLGWNALLEAQDRPVAAIRSVVAVFLLCPKGIAPLTHTETFLDVQGLAHSGARCVTERMAVGHNGRPIVCTALTGLPIDLRPMLEHLHDAHPSVYRALIAEGAFGEKSDP